MLKRESKVAKELNVKHIKKVKPQQKTAATTEKGDALLIRTARPCIPVDGN